MSTNTVASERREVVVTVSIDCPPWCTSAHDRTPAIGLSDVWHNRELARFDEDTHVSLVLAEIDAYGIEAGLRPEISVMLDGDFLEVGRGRYWTPEKLRRLATMCAAAADSLAALLEVETRS